MGEKPNEKKAREEVHGSAARREGKEMREKKERKERKKRKRKRNKKKRR